MKNRKNERIKDLATAAIGVGTPSLLSPGYFPRHPLHPTPTEVCHPLEHLHPQKIVHFP